MAEETCGKKFMKNWFSFSSNWTAFMRQETLPTHSQEDSESELSYCRMIRMNGSVLELNYVQGRSLCNLHYTASA